MVRACQKTGKCAGPEVEKIAKSIGDKDAEDFAKTKHKNLPDKVKKKKKGAKKKMFKSFKEWVEDKEMRNESAAIDNSGYEFTVQDMSDRAKRLGLELVVRSPDNTGVKQFILKDPHMGETIDVSLDGDARRIMRAMDEFERKYPKGTAPWGSEWKRNESFDPKKRLKGKQKELDVAPPFGKIDGKDFERLREKKNK